jgi:predicted transcriptional regulator
MQEKMMATQQAEKRDFTLSVRLRPDMRERLYSVADALGVSPATVASIAIGQYVANAQASANATTKAIEGMMTTMGPQMAEMFTALTTNESEPPCSSSKESSAQLPLLAAEPTAKPAKSSQSVKSSKSKLSTGAASSKSKPSPSPTPSPTPRKSAKK